MLDLSSAEEEEMALDLCILHPHLESVDNLPAGVISGLAEQIYKVSGVAEPHWAKNVMDTKRQEADRVEVLMQAFILAAIPTYTPEQLENMTFTQLAERVALAEQVLKVQQAAITSTDVKLDLVDPEEEAIQHEVAKQRHTTTRKPGQASYDDPIAQKLRSVMG